MSEEKNTDKNDKGPSNKDKAVSEFTKTVDDLSGFAKGIFPYIYTVVDKVKEKFFNKKTEENKSE